MLQDHAMDPIPAWLLWTNTELEGSDAPYAYQHAHTHTHATTQLSTQHACAKPMTVHAKMEQNQHVFGNRALNHVGCQYCHS